MSKSSKGPRTPGNPVFFRPISGISEIKSGYLFKSPPQKRLLVEKSWKKRFFVLFKISEDHHKLLYFSSEDRKESLGDINLSRVSMLHRNPQHQPRWEWVQKTFKCSTSCALYIKDDRREYFLIGETSEEMDGWFNVLFDALKHRPFKFLSPTEISNGEQKIEEISTPIPKKKSPSVPQKVISSPLMKKKIPSPPPMPVTKPRSLSVPDVPSNIIRVEMDQRPVSYPYRPNQSVDPSICSLTIMEENKANNNESSESLYESMEGLNLEEKRTIDGEVYVAPGTLLRSVNEAFDRFRTGSSSLVSVENQKYPSDSEKSQDSSRSSSSATSSNESLKHFQEKPNLSESINTEASKEKDIEVNTADLKKHLTLEQDGKPRVSSWTGLQQDTLGLFLKGDQILAVNDLHTVSRDEFDMLVSKSLKDKVKVTILRLSGGHGDSGNSV